MEVIVAAVVCSPALPQPPASTTAPRHLRSSTLGELTLSPSFGRHSSVLARAREDEEAREPLIFGSTCVFETLSRSVRAVGSGSDGDLPLRSARTRRGPAQLVGLRAVQIRPLSVLFFFPSYFPFLF